MPEFKEKEDDVFQSVDAQLDRELEKFSLEDAEKAETAEKMDTGPVDKETDDLKEYAEKLDLESFVGTIENIAELHEAQKELQSSISIASESVSSNEPIPRAIFQPNRISQSLFSHSETNPAPILSNSEFSKFLDGEIQTYTGKLDPKWVEENKSKLESAGLSIKKNGENFTITNTNYSDNNRFGVIKGSDFNSFLNGDKPSYSSSGTEESKWISKNREMLESKGIEVQVNGENFTLTNKKFQVQPIDANTFHGSHLRGKDFETFLKGEKISLEGNDKKLAEWVKINQEDLQKKGVHAYADESGRYVIQNTKYLPPNIPTSSRRILGRALKEADSEISLSGKLFQRSKEAFARGEEKAGKSFASAALSHLKKANQLVTPLNLLLQSVRNQFSKSNQKLSEPLLNKKENLLKKAYDHLARSITQSGQKRADNLMRAALTYQTIESEVFDKKKFVQKEKDDEDGFGEKLDKATKSLSLRGEDKEDIAHSIELLQSDAILLPIDEKTAHDLVKDIEKAAKQVRTGDMDKAKITLLNIKAKMPEIIRAESVLLKLKKSGAGKEILFAVQKQVPKEQKELLFRASEILSSKKDMLSPEMDSALSKFIVNLADSNIDLKKATHILNQFESMLSKSLRDDAVKSLGFKIRAYQASLDGLANPLKMRFESGIAKYREIDKRLKEDPSSVTDDEIIAAKRLMNGMDTVLSLQPGLSSVKKDVSSKVQSLQAAALHALEMGDEKNFSLLFLASNEYLLSNNEDIYKSASLLEKQVVSSQLSEKTEQELLSILGKNLQKNIIALLGSDGDLSAILASNLTSLDSPNIEDVNRARQAYSILQGMKKRPENRSTYIRALKSSDGKTSEIHRRLGDIKDKEAQKISANLKPETMQEAVLYIELSQKINYFESSRSRYPNLKILDALIFELNQIRNSKTTDEEVATELKLLETRLKSDPNTKLTRNDLIDIARSNVEERKQKTISFLVSVGDSLTKSMSSFGSSNLKNDISEIYGYAIATKNPLFFQAAKTYVNLAESQVTLASERKIVLDYCRDFFIGKTTEKTTQNIIAIQSERAQNESKFKNSEILRNVRSYFDLALNLAKTGKDHETVLDLAVLYSQSASISKTKLSKDEESIRLSAIDFVTSQLGDYINDKGIASRKRIIDGYLPKTTTKISENAVSLLIQHSRKIDDLEFELRARGVPVNEENYHKESKRLESKAKVYDDKQRKEQGDYFRFQATLANRELVTKTIVDVRDIRKMGLAERNKAEELIEEAKKLEGVSDEVARKECLKLLSILPVQYHLTYLEKIKKDPKSIFSELLLIHAKFHNQKSQSLLATASNILSGLETIDQSMKLTTINRHSGRLELYSGILTQIGLAKGYQTDMLGNKIDSKPDEGSSKQMELHALSMLSSGSTMVSTQKTIQTIRNAGLHRAKIELHEKNISQSKELIEGLISTLPDDLQKKYHSLLTSAGTDINKLSDLLSKLGSETNIPTKGSDGKVFYDIVAREAGYQNVKRNFWAEEFGSANKLLSEESFLISSSSLRQNNYLIHHNLQQSLYAGIGGKENTFVVGRLDPTNSQDPALFSRARIMEMITHLPPNERDKYREQLEKISLDTKTGSDDYNKLSNMEKELATKNISAYPGAPSRNLGKMISNGETIYYDPKWLDERIAGAQLKSQSDINGALEELGKVQIDISRLQASQKHENSAIRLRQIGYNILSQRSKENELFEKLTGQESRRPKIELEVRNMLLQDGVLALKNSEERGAKDIIGSAIAHEKARDSIVGGQNPLQINESTVLGVLMAHDNTIFEQSIEVPEHLKKQKLSDGRTYEEVFSGNTFAQVQTSIIDDSSKNKQRGHSTAQGLYVILSANPQRMKAALEVMRGPAFFGFNSGQILQMEASVIESEALNRYTNRQVAWGYSKIMLSKAQDNFRLADMSGSSRRRERNQHSIEQERKLGWAPYRYTDVSHSSHGAAAMEAAIAALDEKNDHTFVKLLTDQTQVTAKIYEKTIGKRDWHPYGRWVTIYTATNGSFSNERRYNRVIDFAGELLNINQQMNKELISYTEAADPKDLDFKGTYGKMAEQQTYLELANLGVQADFTKDGSKIQSTSEFHPTEKEREQLTKSYQQFMALRGTLQSTLFGHDTSWGEDAQENFIKRLGQRMELAEKSGKESISGDSFWGNTGRPSNYIDISQSTLDSSGIIKLENGKIIDPDPLTKSTVSDMSDMAAWNRIAWAGGEFVVATAGVILAPVSGGASLVLTVGVGAKGVASGIQMKEDQGEWSAMSAFQVGAGVATMVLPFAGEVATGLSTGARLTSELALTGVQLTRAQRVGQFLFASRNFSATGLTVAERTMVNILRGSSSASRLQTGVHWAGLGLNASGLAQFGYQIPNMYKMYQEGKMPWFEIAFQGAQQAVGLTGVYRGARRGAVTEMGLYTPKWVQALDMAIGVPPDYHNSLMAGREFSNLPDKLSNSYLEYKSKHRIDFVPETEIKIMREYKKANQDNHISFEQFAKTPEARSLIFEGTFEAVVKGKIPIDSISNEMYSYVKGRLFAEESYLKVQKGQASISSYSKDVQVYITARKSGKNISEAMIAFMDSPTQISNIGRTDSPHDWLISTQANDGKVVEFKEPIQYAIDLQLNNPTNLSQFARDIVLNKGNARGILETLPVPIQDAVKKLAGDQSFIHASQSEGNFKIYVERFAKAKIADLANEIGNHFPPGNEPNAKVLPLEGTTGKPIDVIGTKVEVSTTKSKDPMGVVQGDPPVGMAGKKGESIPPGKDKGGKIVDSISAPPRRESQIEAGKDFLTNLGKTHEIQSGMMKSLFEIAGLDIPKTEVDYLAGQLGDTAKANPLPTKNGKLFQAHSSMQLREISGYPGVYELTVISSKGPVSVIVKARNFNDSLAAMKIYDILGLPHPKTVKINDNIVVQQKMTVDLGNGPEFVSPETALGRLDENSSPIFEGSDRSVIIRDFGEHGIVDFVLGLPDSHLNNFAFFEEKGVIRALRIDYENAGIGWGKGVVNPIRDHEKFWGESFFAHYESGDFASIVKGIENGVARLGKLSEPQIKEVISLFKAHEGETFARGEILTSSKIDDVAKRLRYIRDNPDMAKYEMLEHSFDIWKRAYANPDQGRNSFLINEAEIIFKTKILSFSPEVQIRTKKYFEKLRDSTNPKTKEFADHVLSLFPNDSGPSGKSGPKNPPIDTIPTISSEENIAKNTFTGPSGVIDQLKVANFARDLVLQRGNSKQIFDSLPQAVQQSIKKLVENSAFRIAAQDDKRFESHTRFFGARQLREVVSEIVHNVKQKEANISAIPIEATTGKPIQITAVKSEIDPSAPVAMLGSANPSDARVLGLVQESIGYVDKTSPLHKDAETIRQKPTSNPFDEAKSVLIKKIELVATEITNVAELWISGDKSKIDKAQKIIDGWANDPLGKAKYEALIFMTAKGSEYIHAKDSVAKKLAANIVDEEGGIRVSIPETRAKEIVDIALKYIEGSINLSKENFTPEEARLFARSFDIYSRYGKEVEKISSIMSKNNHSSEEKVIFDRVKDLIDKRGLTQSEAVKHVADEIVRPHAVSLEKSRYIIYNELERSTTGYPSEFYKRDIAPESKQYNLPEVTNPLKGIPRAKLLGRIDRTPGVPLEDTTGASAAVYEVEIFVNGVPTRAAAKVFLDPPNSNFEQNFGYARQELINLEILSQIKVTLPDGRTVPLGPKAYGFVDVGGNPTIAMERIHGRAISEMTPDQIRAYVKPDTYSQLKALYDGLSNSGYSIGDFQFAVLTQDQTVNGVQRKQGDVVFWDAGALIKGKGTDTGEYWVKSSKISADITLISDAFSPKLREDGKTKALVTNDEIQIFTEAIRTIFMQNGRQTSSNPIECAKDFIKMGQTKNKLISDYLASLPINEGMRLRSAIISIENKSGVQILK